VGVNETGEQRLPAEVDQSGAVTLHPQGGLFRTCMDNLAIENGKRFDISRLSASHRQDRAAEVNRVSCLTTSRVNCRQNETSNQDRKQFGYSHFRPQLPVKILRKALG
jgi:hypothetical protein